MTTKHRDGFAVYKTSVEGSPGQGVCGVTAPDSGLPGAAPRPARRGGGRDLRRGDDGRGVRQADWHAHSFWDESLGFSEHVGVNYDIKAMPAKWETFVNLIRRVHTAPTCTATSTSFWSLYSRVSQPRRRGARGLPDSGEPAAGIAHQHWAGPASKAVGGLHDNRGAVPMTQPTSPTTRTGRPRPSCRRW